METHTLISIHFSLPFFLPTLSKGRCGLWALTMGQKESVCWVIKNGYTRVFCDWKIQTLCS